MANFERVYKRLAVEVEHLSSFVTKRKDEAEARHAMDALDLGRVAVRGWPWVKASNNLG